MTTKTQTNFYNLYQVHFSRDEQMLTISLSGELGLKNLTAFSSDIRREIAADAPQSIDIDFSGVCYLDSAAALALIQIEREAASKKYPAGLLI